MLAPKRRLKGELGGVGWGREGRASCEGEGERSRNMRPRRQGEHVAIVRQANQIGRSQEIILPGLVKHPLWANDPQIRARDTAVRYIGVYLGRGLWGLLTGNHKEYDSTFVLVWQLNSRISSVNFCHIIALTFYALPSTTFRYSSYCRARYMPARS